jgi:hypothetical protein
MNSYTWRSATGSDVIAIVNLANDYFKDEINNIFTIDTLAGSRNITLAIVNQFYNPNSELVKVAEDNTGKIIAYVWAKGQQRSVWSDESMVSINMAHASLDLTSRQRIKLVFDMIELWEQFANQAQAKIICSTTMRNDQQAFLKIHQRCGYDVRGSYAYKRLI